jgi:hypothetical protein
MHGPWQLMAAAGCEMGSSQSGLSTAARAVALGFTQCINGHQVTATQLGPVGPATTLRSPHTLPRAGALPSNSNENEAHTDMDWSYCVKVQLGIMHSAELITLHF